MGNNRRNHNFQIVHFLVGSKHTPDGAYSMLCDLKEEREMALSVVKASSLRAKVKELAAKRKMASDDEIERLEGEADLSELESSFKFTQRNIDAAVAELAFIEDCIAKIQPLRKYANVSDAEAHELAQAEEWKQELIYRIQNFLLTTGTIPPDHFATMRQHPAFLTDLLPAIDANHKRLANGTLPASITAEKPKFLERLS